MKWFKYLTGTLDDPFMYDLIHEYGSDGYLVYFGTVEIVARECKDFDNFLTLSHHFLAKSFQLSVQKIKKILNYIAISGRFEYSDKNSKFLIRIPKLSELSDNYTSKYVRSNFEVTSENVPPRIRIRREKKKKKIEEEYIKGETVAVATAPKTPQADFIAKWGQLYKAKTGYDYNADSKDYILIANLLKKYSSEQVLEKAKILFDFCVNFSAWFTKGGMADFTIGKLSSKWNEIIPERKDLTAEDKNKLAVAEFLERNKNGN